MYNISKISHHYHKQQLCSLRKKEWSVSKKENRALKKRLKNIGEIGGMSIQCIHRS